jgi:photosystem II stability/assembly factor-like uncharacterized protein
VVAVGSLLVTGCGTGGRPGTRAVTTAPVTRPDRCEGPERLAAGANVAAWRLGAVRFVSARSGIALTAPQVPCDRSLGPGRGTEVTFVAQTVRLAVTGDGGRHWMTRGSEVPGPTQSPEPEQVAAVSGPDIWVVSDAGVLLATRDYGATWAIQPLPAPTVAAASAGGWLWAVSCPAVSQNWCRPVVERMRLPGGKWTRAPLAAPSALPDVQLTVLSGRAAVLVIWGPHPALVSTADGGRHWSVRPPPAGPPIPCGQDPPGSFTAASPDDWWLLCMGGAAAGSSTKALWRSADAGRTWTAVSANTSLAGPRPAGSLPGQDGAVIAAGSAGRLWIVTPNTISVSTDGGASWSTTQLDPQGSLGQFDVLSSTLAWVLAPGAGLWQTADGITWRPVGGAGPLTTARSDN